MVRSPMYFVKTHYGAGWKCRSFPDHRETYCQGLYACMLQVKQMKQMKQVKQMKQMKQTASRARFKKPTVKAGALWRWVGIQLHPGDDEGSGRPVSLEGMESPYCESKRARKTVTVR